MVSIISAEGNSEGVIAAYTFVLKSQEYSSDCMRSIIIELLYNP
jgi:hypothetical protein